MGDVISIVLLRSDVLILAGLGIAMILLYCLFRNHTVDTEAEAVRDSPDHEQPNAAKRTERNLHRPSGAPREKT